MRTWFGIAALTLAVAGAGCIEKETTHTIYLSSEGAVAWTTLEDDVRSASESGQAAREEEASYLAAALAGTNDVAAAFGPLEPSRVQTRVLRRERPFTVMTEARFPDVAILGARILGEFGLPGDVYVTKDGEVTTLHLHLDFRAVAEDGGRETAVLALLDPLSTYRIVLTDGHFVSAEGFTLDPGGRIARPIASSDDVPVDVVDLSLSWRR